MNNWAKILIIGMVLSTLVLAGCVRQAEEPEPVDTTPIPTPEPQTDRSEIEVTMSEWSISPGSMRADAGTVKFTVSNEGNIYHEFRVSGGGVDEEIEGGVRSGEVRILEVDLVPGTYRIDNPIPGRDEKGMVSTLIVS